MSELFRSIQYIKTRYTEIIPEQEAQRLVAEIVHRTRTHPDIARGVSVRGTIAFDEITKSLSTLAGGLTRLCIRKAALITLSPRIALKQTGNEADIINGIVREVFFGRRPPDDSQAAVSTFPAGPFNGNVREMTGKIDGTERDISREADDGIRCADVTEENRAGSLQTCLEKTHSLENDRQGQYGLTARSLKFLLAEEKQDILTVVGKSSTEASGSRFKVSALDTMLKYLIHKGNAEKRTQGLKGFGAAPGEERSSVVRRYAAGDAFRNISRRHTLREIVRQKKNLSQVRQRDVRVFLKQPRNPKTDIILCMDTSASMSLHRKMAYARLAAAGLVAAASDEGHRIGIVDFNSRGQVRMPLTVRSKDTLLDCILGLYARGQTNIADGIKAAGELLFQTASRNRKYIILITDGEPTALSETAFSRLKGIRHRDPTQEAALLATRQAVAGGILVSVIYIADPGQAEDVFINSIVKIGKGTLYRIRRAADLKAVFKH